MLERIDEPAALRGLSQQELDELAREVRDLLIGTVSENGGHL
ncbi:MAG: 1-deoxy-D-xylulose-5-phosphate synthase N-terminal domain-containing protein, partial [Dehalococcoidia bacterium]